MRLPRLFVFVFALVLLPSIARAQVPEAVSSDNAALQYWKAFSFLPSLDMEQEKILDELTTVPLDDAAVKLITSSQNSLMFLHRGAQLPQCDWGLDYNDGVGLLLPHLPKARSLARLAALRARYYFEQGNWKAGRRDVTAMLALARHLGKDPILICLLVQYNLEGLAIDVAAPYVSDLKAPAERIRTELARLPKGATLEQALKTERKYFTDWIVVKLKEAEAKKAGSWRDLWNNLLQEAEVPKELKEIESLEKALDLMAKMAPIEEELTRLVALPNEEFAKQYPEFKRKATKGNPLVSVLMPAMDELRSKRDRNEARLQMLLAAVAVANDGEKALKEFPDPFGEGPFEYRKLDSGFELQSKLTYEGKPVVLQVGQRKK